MTPEQEKQLREHENVVNFYASIGDVAKFQEANKKRLEFVKNLGGVHV